MKKGGVGRLAEEMGNAAFENSPGNSGSCKVTLGFYAKSGYKRRIPQHCLNLGPAILPSHAKQERTSQLLSKAKTSVTFLNSDV